MPSRTAADTAKRDPARAKPIVSAIQFATTSPDDATVAAEHERFRDMLAFLFSSAAY